KNIALCVLVHLLGSCERRLLAKVNERGLPVAGAQQQKPTSTKIAGDRMHDSKRESCGYCGVYCIAPCTHDVDSRIGGEMMHADNHAVLRCDGLLSAIREDVDGAFLRTCGARSHEGKLDGNRNCAET